MEVIKKIGRTNGIINSNNQHSISLISIYSLQERTSDDGHSLLHQQPQQLCNFQLMFYNKT